MCVVHNVTHGGGEWEGLDYEVNRRLIIRNQKMPFGCNMKFSHEQWKKITARRDDEDEKENDGRKGNARWVSSPLSSPSTRNPSADVLCFFSFPFLPDQIGISFSSSHLLANQCVVILWRWLRLTNTGFLNFVDSIVEWPQFQRDGNDSGDSDYFFLMFIFPFRQFSLTRFLFGFLLFSFIVTVRVVEKLYFLLRGIVHKLCAELCKFHNFSCTKYKTF